MSGNDKHIGTGEFQTQRRRDLARQSRNQNGAVDKPQRREEHREEELVLAKKILQKMRELRQLHCQDAKRNCDLRPRFFPFFSSSVLASRRLCVDLLLCKNRMKHGAEKLWFGTFIPIHSSSDLGRMIFFRP